MIKMNEIRKLTTAELNKKLEENKKELFNLKFALSTGNLEKPHRIKELRHEVAKIKTVIRERELNESKEEAK
jgi:large subunit ribosomal protein L29